MMNRSILILFRNQNQSGSFGLVKNMSLIRRLSCGPQQNQARLVSKFSMEDNQSLHPPAPGFSDLSNYGSSDCSLFGMMGCPDLMNSSNLVRKYSEQEEMLHDRFIPMRKTSSLVACQDQESVNNENCNGPQDTEAFSISNLYRKHVLSINNAQPQFGLEAFKNNNTLKFRQTNCSKESSFLPRGGACLEINDEILESAGSKHRKIPKLPAKVLDAPALQDDFYLNLIDWSQQNLLSVGLGSSVYLWSALSSKVMKLCDLGLDDSVTSVGWSLRGPLLGVGTNTGQVQIWDTTKNKKVRTISGHSSRIGAIAWNSNVISSGSRDKTILNRDIRCSTGFQSKLVGHKQQVCGLKWSPDQQQLCSGGNDNKIFIWNTHSTNHVYKFSDHVAAVKAIAWSPHQHGLLVSGGGTADRSIRFWNTLIGTKLQSLDVGSQVCNLMFSKTVNQLVSTHGYSQNQINIWKYPKMQKISTLTGHTYRVLYLAMSPDGSTIVTGAGDETLRFWNVFPGTSDKTRKKDSNLMPNTICLR